MFFGILISLDRPRFLRAKVRLESVFSGRNFLPPRSLSHSLTSIWVASTCYNAVGGAGP